jgi:hypothetical protein
VVSQAKKPNALIFNSGEHGQILARKIFWSKKRLIINDLSPSGRKNFGPCLDGDKGRSTFAAS